MGMLDRLFSKRKSTRVDPLPSTLPAELHFEPNGPLLVSRCPGHQALATWKKLRGDGAVSGFTAVILGAKDDLDMLSDNRAFIQSSPTELLQRATSLDVENWLHQRRDRDSEHCEASMGTWPPGSVDQGSISAHLEILSGQPRAEVFIAKVPTPRNWEAPIYVGMGGWNDCPNPEVLSAFAKRWNEQYGAEIVSITHDVMEFTVSRPPSTREAALKLAEEQFVCCMDIVDQGVGDISSLAATLLNSDYWYFWWD